MSTRDDDPRLYFNGLTETGEYLQEPLLPEELGRRLLELPKDWELPPDPEERDLEDPTRAVLPWVDQNDLAEAGWAVVFAAGADPDVRRALQPLLDLRRLQARHRYQERVYVPHQSLDEFLFDVGGLRAVADPDRFPYYVLLVGGPEEIPFSFQYQLDKVYAVGRICFDRVEDYDAYARSVVDAEERRLRRRREVAFFAPENPGDRATERTHRELVAPLADQLETSPPAAGWALRRHLAEEATKATLNGLLDGSETPALLFAAGHGLAAFPGSEDQEVTQGALVTSDWRGRQEGSRMGPEHRFTAADLEPEASPAGLVAFLYACYGAGTPQEDSFFRLPWSPPHLARRSFVSRLSQALLARRRGGALAVVGHVDRAWTTSFDWFGDQRQREVFQVVLRCLLEGWPVGAATEYLGQLAGDLAVQLEDSWTRQHRKQWIDPEDFARLRLAHGDARNFVVFGDPAVRLAVD